MPNPMRKLKAKWSIGLKNEVCFCADGAFYAGQYFPLSSGSLLCPECEKWGVRASLIKFSILDLSTHTTLRGKKILK
jgi:hypothetical protein